MPLSTNTTYRLLVEKLGATDPDAFVGNEGEVFYDPSVASLKLSDGSTAGGTTIGGGGGGGESYWESTGAGINTSSNVGVGTTNPQTKLQVGGVIGFNDTNIRIGDNTTGANLTSGSNNIFMGVGAGNSNTDGSNNNFLGNNAGQSNTSGYYNNFFGFNSGKNNTSGENNNFFGSYAGIENTDGSYNNFFGGYAGLNNTEGGRNNFIGILAGEDNTTGNYNNFFGTYAGSNNTIGFDNTFIGRRAGERNETGNANSFIGRESGKINKFGSNNTYFGNFTGVTTSGNYKVLIGSGFAVTRRFDIPKDATDSGTPAGSDIQLAIGVRTDNNPSNYWIVGDENFNVGVGTTNPTSKLTVQNGDIKVGVNTSEGLILTDSNGVAWRLIVNTDGTLTTTAV